VSNPDDWFGGAAADEDEPLGPDGAAEDWLQAEQPARPPWYQAVDRRLVVAAVVAVAALIAVLAAAGVFSGGGRPAPPVPTEAATTTAPPSSPTTTTPPAASVPVPTATLKPGDTGAQVKLLQRALTTLGYSTGKADGSYGPATEAATKRFQQSAGLKADGIVGPATLRALAGALRNR